MFTLPIEISADKKDRN